MGTNFTNQIRNFLPPGCYALKQRASAWVARVEPVSRRRRCSRLTFSALDEVRQHLASPAKMAPNEHEFHESDEKFLAPGAVTSSNNALQRGWLLSGWGFHPQPQRWAVAASAHGLWLTGLLFSHWL